MSEMPINIVSRPCPGKKSMAMPAKKNTTPMRFLRIKPNSRNKN